MNQGDTSLPVAKGIIGRAQFFRPAATYLPNLDNHPALATYPRPTTRGIDMQAGIPRRLNQIRPRRHDHRAVTGQKGYSMFHGVRFPRCYSTTCILIESTGKADRLPVYC